MTLEEFLELAEDYASLGSSITEQLTDVLKGQSLSDQNPNALQYIVQFLSSLESASDQELADDATDISDKIKKFLKEDEQNEDEDNEDEDEEPKGRIETLRLVKKD